VRAGADLLAGQSGGRRLTHHDGFDYTEVCLVNLDGTGLDCLTDNDVLDAHANWW